MTMFDFLDKHWGFWFAIFLLIVLTTLVKGILIIATIIVRFIKWGVEK